MSKAREKFLKIFKEKNIEKKLINIISGIDRAEFFDPVFADKVYGEELVPIGCGQKSDDPIIMARMIELLAPAKDWRILEVGTGSGFATAILASLAPEIITIDLYEELVAKAKKNLFGNGFSTVRLFAGDGTNIDEDLGTFNGIIIWGSCVHSPYALLNILKSDGRAVFPMGLAHQQQIARYTNNVRQDANRNFTFFDFCAVDPIRGRYGWKDQPPLPVLEEDEEEKTEK